MRYGYGLLFRVKLNSGTSFVASPLLPQSMKTARPAKSKTLSGLSWAVALSLLWLWGASAASAFHSAGQPEAAPKTIAALLAASSAGSKSHTEGETEHVNCFCMMCKGKKKASCCCASKASKTNGSQPGCVITERCDGAASPDALAAGSTLPLTVLPTLSARPLPPSHIERAHLVFPACPRPATGRTPIPPEAPPQTLS